MEAAHCFDIELLFPWAYLDPVTRLPFYGKFMAAFIRGAVTLRVNATVI